jgi:hypothetical protein
VNEALVSLSGSCPGARLVSPLESAGAQTAEAEYLSIWAEIWKAIISLGCHLLCFATSF